MARPVDRHEFFQNVQAQTRYETPLPQGTYLGFVVAGNTVLMRHVPGNGQLDDAPQVVSCPIAKLFE